MLACVFGLFARWSERTPKSVLGFLFTFISTLTRRNSPAKPAGRVVWTSRTFPILRHTPFMAAGIRKLLGNFSIQAQTVILSNTTDLGLVNPSYSAMSNPWFRKSNGPMFIAMPGLRCVYWGMRWLDASID